MADEGGGDDTSGILRGMVVVTQQSPTGNGISGCTGAGGVGLIGRGGVNPLLCSHNLGKVSADSFSIIVKLVRRL